MRKLKRGCLELKRDVLRAVERGYCRPNRIMQIANIDPKRFPSLRQELTDRGLITVEENTSRRGWRKVGLTEKGSRTLKLLRELEGLIGP